MLGVLPSHGSAADNRLSPLQRLSELVSCGEGFQCGESLAALLEVMGVGEINKTLNCDSKSALHLCTNDTGSWRTRHLRIGYARLREAYMEKANARAPNEPALRHEGREDEPPRRLLKTMVRAPNEPTMREHGRENEPPMKSQERAKVGTQEPPNHCPTGCHGMRGPQVRMLRQSHGKPSQERQALAAIRDDPIEDFSEPGLEPPKPEVQVRMHGAMELGEVPLVMDERPTSLPTTRAPMAEMTKQEAKELFATIQGHELLRKPP